MDVRQEERDRNDIELNNHMLEEELLEIGKFFTVIFIYLII